jgi:hypothetical protein
MIDYRQWPRVAIRCRGGCENGKGERGTQQHMIASGFLCMEDEPGTQSRREGIIGMAVHVKSPVTESNPGRAVVAGTSLASRPPGARVSLSPFAPLSLLLFRPLSTIRSVSRCSDRVHFLRLSWYW